MIYATSSSLYLLSQVSSSSTTPQHTQPDRPDALATFRATRQSLASLGIMFTDTFGTLDGLLGNLEGLLQSLCDSTTDTNVLQAAPTTPFYTPAAAPSAPASTSSAPASTSSAPAATSSAPAATSSASAAPSSAPAATSNLTATCGTPFVNAGAAASSAAAADSKPADEAYVAAPPSPPCTPTRAAPAASSRSLPASPLPAYADVGPEDQGHVWLSDRRNFIFSNWQGDPLLV